MYCFIIINTANLFFVKCFAGKVFSFFKINYAWLCHFVVTKIIILNNMCLTSNLVTLYYTDTRAAQFWIIEDHVFCVKQDHDS